MAIDRDTLLKMYATMVKIRYFEERMARIYQEGKTPLFDISAGPVPGEMHLSAGQEPPAVGVCLHLRPEDTVTGPHRAHHIAIAKDVDLKKMAAEIFGKSTGLGKGKGGHMHLFDPAAKFACSGIIAAGAPPAVGAALAAKKMGKDWVAVNFAGEGAANQGGWHESLNLAALWKLPVIFVVEDNSWAISVPKTKSTAVQRNSERAVAYGIPGVYIPDNDPVAIYEAAGEAVARARRGEGPSLIEVKTDRYFGHFEGDPQLYRPKDEVEELKKRDPIDRLKRQMLEQGVFTEADAERIAGEVKAEVDEAIEFARQSPYPEPQEALQDVFAAA
ncbi:MAG TPA: pyruvate dehydrogenase (acetyl-transferring) E1 component subunit alpha [Chloroflexi bacterium]|nr:pyruvate dehydrogenase (acetyl-transferring) E1 component subunit alpha [Chloroflexota bacterium]